MTLAVWISCIDDCRAGERHLPVLPGCLWLMRCPSWASLPKAVWIARWRQRTSRHRRLCRAVLQRRMSRTDGVWCAATARSDSTSTRCRARVARRSFVGTRSRYPPGPPGAPAITAPDCCRISPTRFLTQGPDFRKILWRINDRKSS